MNSDFTDRAIIFLLNSYGPMHWRKLAEKIGSDLAETSARIAALVKAGKVAECHNGYYRSLA